MSKNHIIDVSELADYVVCPYAWYLKQKAKTKQTNQDNKLSRAREINSHTLRKHWTRSQDSAAEFRYFAKISFLLLILLVCVVFLLERSRIISDNHWAGFRSATGEISFEIYGLLILLGIIIFLWDIFDRKGRAQTVGESSKPFEIVGVKGGKYRNVKRYVSHQLCLQSTPDATIKENGVIIPVRINPMSSKIRDRHVITLVGDMRLLTEIENKSPPYGILVMGRKNKNIRIQNTAEKQQWLDNILKEIKAINNGTPALASPASLKCRHCDVKSICSFSAANSRQK